MKIRTIPALSALAIAALHLPACARDARIVGEMNGDEIVLTASGDRFAGAINSLTYRGVQYIDTADHGREMQSAIQLDGWGECYNPNEAGSYADADGAGSTSVLEAISSHGNVLKTRTRPAYWMGPRQRRAMACNPNLESPRNQARTALNTAKLSEFTVSRKAAFHSTIPGLIEVGVEWRIPGDFKSMNAEASTGYLPGSFDLFLVYDRASGTLRKVAATAADSVNQHTDLPVIISRKDGVHAMGAFAPELMKNPGRGYMAFFSFAEDRKPTSKWSCVFGEVDIRKGSTYSYSCPIVIGSVDQVIAAINAYPVAGQHAGTSVAVYRFFNGRYHFMTTSFTEAAAAGYAFEETGFHAYPAGGTGLKRLYRCYDAANGSHFVSDAADCERARNEGTIGWARTVGGGTRVPLHRFANAASADRLVTVNRKEGERNGLRYERLLGYVEPPRSGS